MAAVLPCQEIYQDQSSPWSSVLMRHLASKEHRLDLGSHALAGVFDLHLSDHTLDESANGHNTHHFIGCSVDSIIDQVVQQPAQPQLVHRHPNSRRAQL